MRRRSSGKLKRNGSIPLPDLGQRASLSCARLRTPTIRKAEPFRRGSVYHSSEPCLLVIREFEYQLVAQAALWSGIYFGDFATSGDGMCASITQFIPLPGWICELDRKFARIRE